MSELKPCPFCGHTPKMHKDVWDAPNGRKNRSWWVMCAKCGSCSGEFRSEAKATDAWNMRAGNAAEVVRCKDCKHLMFSDCYGECGKRKMGIVSPEDYCSYGERKEGADND